MALARDYASFCHPVPVHPTSPGFWLDVDKVKESSGLLPTATG